MGNHPSKKKKPENPAPDFSDVPVQSPVRPQSVLPEPDHAPHDWNSLDIIFNSHTNTLQPDPNKSFQNVEGISTVSSISLNSHRYFEIEIESLPPGAVIAIGLKQDSEIPTQVLPGWLPGTIGFHSDDGHIYIGSEQGKIYGPEFKQGDRIGCGIQWNYNDNPSPDKIEDSSPLESHLRQFQLRIFFTKNGCQLPSIPVPENFSGFFPFIGFNSSSKISVKVNFNPNYWLQSLNNLGQISFQEKEDKTSLIYSLNSDILKYIFFILSRLRGHRPIQHLKISTRTSHSFSLQILINFKIFV